MTSHELANSCMRHEPQSRRFINVLGDGRIVVKLQSTCDSIQDARLIWRDGKTERKHELERLGRVDGNEFFSATVPARKSGEYIFHVDACGQLRWLTPRGLEFNSVKPEQWFRYESRSHPPFATPAWVRDAVFYQIFPERFWNGNLTGKARIPDPPISR